MLRVILLAVGISLVAVSTPALSQNFKGSCSDWCLKNKCGHGAMNQPICMKHCVDNCKAKNPNAKD